MEKKTEHPIIEVVCDPDDPGCPRLVKWKEKAENLEYFEARHSRYILGKAFPIIHDAMVLPEIPVPYGSTKALFDSVRSMLSQEVCLLEPTLSLVTYWTLMSWFADVLPLAPALAITGGEYEADLLLRSLSWVCRYPIMLCGINPGTTRMLPTDIMTPTLLVYEPRLTARMASLLATSNTPGYFVPSHGRVQDLYCPKAIYLGEHPGKYALGANSISVTLIAANTGFSKRHVLQRRVMSEFQNRLLRYRMKNYYQVRDAEFTLPPEFMPSTAAIAQVLAAVIVDDDDLRQEVIPLLSSADAQLHEAHRNTLEGFVIEAALSFCHEPDRQHVFALEVAQVVNRIYANLGERSHVSEEKVGHALKRLGLFTRRLGNKGRGLELGKETQFLLHELARLHQVEAFQDHPDCAYCQGQETKEVV